MHDAQNQPVVLITGCNGFSGRHMARFLRGVENQPRIIGFDLAQSGHPALSGEFVGDIRDPDALGEAFRICRPEIVIHLAGAMPPTPDDEMHDIIVSGAANLLKIAAECRPAPRVLVIGSAAEYGPTEAARINEDHPCRPAAAYGRSKLEQTLLCRSYATDRDLPVIVARPFNLFGPRMPARTVIGEICAQIAAAENGDEIHLGNLSSARDFMDVRDAVAAYWLLALRGAPGEAYNVCRGEATAVGDLADMLIELSGKRLVVKSRTERLQKNDVRYSCGDCGKLAGLGILPSRRGGLIDSLRDTLASFSERSLVF